MKIDTSLVSELLDHVDAGSCIIFKNEYFIVTNDRYSESVTLVELLTGNKRSALRDSIVIVVKARVVIGD